MLGINVISYLRDKLPRYDIDLAYMFDMIQNDCDTIPMESDIPPSILANRIPPTSRNHPLKGQHKNLF